MSWRRRTAGSPRLSPSCVGSRKLALQCDVMTLPGRRMRGCCVLRGGSQQRRAPPAARRARGLAPAGGRSASAYRQSADGRHQAGRPCLRPSAPHPGLRERAACRYCLARAAPAARARGACTSWSWTPWWSLHAAPRLLLSWRRFWSLLCACQQLWPAADFGCRSAVVHAMRLARGEWRSQQFCCA